MTNARQLGIPMYVHFLGGDATREWLRKPEIQALYRWIGENAQGILTLSDVMTKRLVDAGFPSKKMTKVRCGVEFSDSISSGVTAANCRFVSITRLFPKKGPLLLLRAFKLAVAQRPEITLDLVGDGPLMPEVREFIAQNGLDRMVKVHGSLPFAQARALLLAGSVYCQHSITCPDSGDAEGLPVAILDASSVGLPILSTRHEGIPEAVQDGETGYLVAEGDVEAMAQNMVKLASDPGLRQRLGAAAREKIAREFSIATMVRGMRQAMNLDVQDEPLKKDSAPTTNAADSTGELKLALRRLSQRLAAVPAKP